MSTTLRFKLARTGSAPAAPAFNAGWETSGEASRLPMSTTAANTTMSNTGAISKVAADTVDVLARQWVGPGDLSAKVYVGTFKFVMKVHQTNSGEDCHFQPVVGICATDGTIRGYLYAPFAHPGVSASSGADNEEFPAGSGAAATRIFDETLVAVTAQASDHLFVDFGYTSYFTGTTGGATFYIGDPTATADHTFASGSTTNDRPWIEFTFTDIPNVPTSLGQTHDHDSIDFTWAAPSGGDAATGYKVRINGGSSTDVGNVFAHTFSGLTPSTAYTMEVLAYNAAGDGSWASLGTTTDAAPVASATPDPAQERVPLNVRVGNKHITREVSALQIRKEAIGGVKSISLRLARPLDRFDPDLDALSSVYVYDGRTAETIAEGRLTDFGRSASAGDGQQWDMVAFGPGQHASDEPLPLVYFDSGTDKWRRSTYNVGSTQTVYDEIDENTPGCMLRPTEGATVTTSWLADMIYRGVRRAGMDLGRIKCTWDSGVSNSDFVLQLVTRTGTGGGATAASASANVAGGTLSAVVVTDFTQGDDVVSVRVVRNTSSITAGENQFFHFYNFAIRALIYNADGTARTTGYTNDYLLAHEVVNDLLGRGGLDQYDGTNATVATGGTYQIDQMAYPDGATAEQVLTDLMTLEPAYRWWAGPDVTGSGYEFHWEPWPTTVRYEVTLNDGGDFPSSWQEVYNKVTVRWTDKNGLSRTNTRTLAVAEFDAASPPITRSTIIDLADEIGSTAAADRAGDNFLAEHNVPANAGTINIARPIRDLTTGRMVRPHEIEAGELIRVRGIESYPDALNASSNDGLTVFRIWSATYNSDSDSAALELDTWSRSTANAIARLAKRRNRKR